jgi:hypothetical protein
LHDAAISTAADQFGHPAQQVTHVLIAGVHRPIMGLGSKCRPAGFAKTLLSGIGQNLQTGVFNLEARPVSASSTRATLRLRVIILSVVFNLKKNPFKYQPKTHRSRTTYNRKAPSCHASC